MSKLYVGNLSFDTTEQDIQALFTQHGPVTDVSLIMDKMTGRSRGFAFVTMGTPEAAATAIQSLDGESFGGRNLTVNEARPQGDRPSGGGYSGGGGGGGDRRRSGGGGGGGGGRRDFGRR